jgi:hypothetical protein
MEFYGNLLFAFRRTALRVEQADDHYPASPGRIA